MGLVVASIDVDVTSATLEVLHWCFKEDGTAMELIQVKGAQIAYSTCQGVVGGLLLQSAMT